MLLIKTKIVKSGAPIKAAGPSFDFNKAYINPAPKVPPPIKQSSKKNPFPSLVKAKNNRALIIAKHGRTS